MILVVCKCCRRRAKEQYIVTGAISCSVSNACQVCDRYFHSSEKKLWYFSYDKVNADYIDNRDFRKEKRPKGTCGYQAPSQSFSLHVSNRKLSFYKKVPCAAGGILSDN